MILSDLVHFDASHDVLIASLTSLLRPAPESRVYMAAGNYTEDRHVKHFLGLGDRFGISWQQGEDDHVWRGPEDVWGGGLNKKQLGVRKSMCRWWSGRWR